MANYGVVELSVAERPPLGAFNARETPTNFFPRLVVGCTEQRDSQPPFVVPEIWLPKLMP